jgi:membrane-associated phospholipid phosphatase
MLGASLTVGILLAIVAAAMFSTDRTLTVPVFFSVVLAGEILLTNAIKGIVDRSRPAFDQVVDTTGSSFPSGHSAAAAAAYLALALVLSRGRPPAVRRWLLAGAVVIAIMVAASRVMLGVHWFTDVVGGLAFGWGWATACALVILARPVRRRLEEPDAQDAPKELTPQ